VVVVSEDEGMIGVLICRDCGHSEWEDALQVCPLCKIGDVCRLCMADGRCGECAADDDEKGVAS
jgi:hypothetical protein